LGLGSRWAGLTLLVSRRLALPLYLGVLLLTLGLLLALLWRQAPPMSL
jgi:hypothetical protein